MDAKAEDFDEALLEVINSWHGGMGSPEYRLSSNAYGGHDVPLDVVEMCMVSLERSLTMVKVRLKEKKKGVPAGYTKKDQHQLEAAIDTLNWIYNARSKGHEPV